MTSYDSRLLSELLTALLNIPYINKQYQAYLKYDALWPFSLSLVQAKDTTYLGLTWKVGMKSGETALQTCKLVGTAFSNNADHS
jgi:hypothetical protein